jgi:putative transposase
MGDSNEIRTGRHCIFALHAHLVFVTKYRHRVFTARRLERMEEIMRAVCVDFECELVEFNGGSNHIHLLVNFPPKVALSKLVNSLKGVSSRRMRQEFPNSFNTIGGRNACGRALTSRARSVVPRCQSCGSTSNSRTVPSRARSGLSCPPA